MTTGNNRPGFFANMFGMAEQQPNPSHDQQQPPVQQPQQPQEIPNENQLAGEFELRDRGNGNRDGVDPSQLLASFFSEDDSESEENSEDENEDDNNSNQPRLDANGNPLPSKKEQEILTGIQSIMKTLTPAEDLIPEDFNPNDPRALRGILGAVQQQTAQATLQMMLIPMREAMSTLSEELKADFSKQLQNHGSQSTAQQTLARIVPEVNGEHSGMVKTLYGQAMKKKDATPEKAARAVRQALDALGIKGSGNQEGNPSDPSQGASRRSGSGALDMYAPLR